MLLALDTSTYQIGIALYDGAQVLAEMTWRSRVYHTVELAPAVELLCSRIGCLMSDLEAIGVAIGPGSFTALRIGLAFAKGLALSLHAPLVGVPSLDILAAAQPLENGKLAAVLSAGRRRLAVGWYRVQDERWRALGKLENISRDEFLKRLTPPVLVAGELDGDLRAALNERQDGVKVVSPAASLRRPAVLSELAWARWRAGSVDDLMGLAPIYLHQGEPIPG